MCVNASVKDSIVAGAFYAWTLKCLTDASSNSCQIQVVFDYSEINYSDDLLRVLKYDI